MESVSGKGGGVVGIVVVASMPCLEANGDSGGTWCYVCCTKMNKRVLTHLQSVRRAVRAVHRILHHRSVVAITRVVRVLAPAAHAGSHGAGAMTTVLEGTNLKHTIFDFGVREAHSNC